MQDIRIEYTGHFRRPPVDTFGDAQCMRVVLVTSGEKGTVETTLFTGADFDEQELIWRMESNPSLVTEELLARLKSQPK